MDSGYFDEEIIEIIESLGCKYLIKAKGYRNYSGMRNETGTIRGTSKGET